MKTLAEKNANPYRTTWNGVEVETTYAVGGMGRSFSMSRAGVKVHLIRVDTIVETGKVISRQALCNGRGSWTGIVARGWDTDKVNCKNCGG